MSHSTKRLLTEETHTSNSSENAVRHDGLSPELLDRLRRVGPRTRMNVDRGYATRAYSSSCVLVPDRPSVTAFSPHSAGKAIFCSTNDTLNDIFSSPQSKGRSQTPSPSKRSRAEMERELGEDFDVDGAGDTVMENAYYNPDRTAAMSTALEGCTDTRPVKPLRRSRRIFTETVSLPANFLFSEPSSIRSNTQGNPHAGEEEDWSLELPNVIGA